MRRTSPMKVGAGMKLAWDFNIGCSNSIFKLKERNVFKKKDF
jgi:hypothetical protein